MALKIRLRKQGRTNRPFYRVVVADIRSPRDGRFVENLGWYNPFGHTSEHEVSLNGERLTHWIEMGAQLSENVWNLMKKVTPDLCASVLKREQERRTARCKKRKERRHDVA